MAENDDKRAIPFAHCVNSGPDQHGANSLALSFGQYGHGRKPHALGDFVAT